MIILITGGAKCGKSRIAENILSARNNNKFYIAAMEPFGEEALKAIEDHRISREGKGFTTIEKPRDIHEISLPSGSLALLECLPTLTANEMFGENTTDPSEKVFFGIKKLSKNAEKLVIVTNDISCDGTEYPPETTNYIRVLCALNGRLAELSDIVVEAVCGIPVFLKGALP